MAAENGLADDYAVFNLSLSVELRGLASASSLVAPVSSVATMHDNVRYHCCPLMLLLQMLSKLSPHLAASLDGSAAT